MRNHVKIEYPEYIQLIGFLLRQAGVIGVILYGERPLYLSIYSWDEWMGLLSAFNRGFLDGQDPRCARGAGSPCLASDFPYAYEVRDDILRVVPP